MKLNRVLLILTLALFLASFWSYRESAVRAERFERGQKFLPHLNPDEIAEILLTKGEQTTHLKRSDRQFVVTSALGYPAKNEAVNRFVRDVLELALDKEVGSGEKLATDLELRTSDGKLPANSLEVVLKDRAEKEMVRFRVGKAFAEGSGNYVQRVGEQNPIYLTSSRVYFSTAADDFLDQEILDVEKAKLTAILGADFRIESEGGQLVLRGLPAGKKTSGKFNQLETALSPLRFQQHFLANDPAVFGLQFITQVEFALNDDSGYQIALAERGGKYFLKVQGFHQAQRVSIARDADLEEVKKTADVLARIDELQRFNTLHGSWIYEVSEGTATKFRVTQKDLFEGALAPAIQR